jgi:hypothetical protein
MAKYEFDKKKFEEWKQAQKESAELQEKMNGSLNGYMEGVKKLTELQKNLQFIEQKVAQLKKEQVKAENDLLENTKKLNKATASGDADEIKALKEKEKELKKIIAAKKEGVAITEKELGLLKQQTAELTEQVKQTSLISAGLGSAVGFLGKVPGLITKGFGMLKGTGIFEMDKEIRNAVRSMAGGQKQYNNMLTTIQGAADTTTMWGVGVKDLAIMQRGYSEAIGKSVMLTEQGYKAMAGMAEGTGLGKEFAVGMAAEMDKFNISAERTGSIVEMTMNKAAKLGVNGAAALKSLQNNLKLAQRFNFKGGIAGLAKLSVEATRLKLDMEGIAGMAEKVFRPEGAIEMAAELTTMGGEFAKLGDPMTLLFKSRNDMEGFTKDVGKASAEFVQFNKETGEFDIKGGLAADRMREISRITGIAVDKLQEMGSAQLKVVEVGKSLKGGIFNKEDSDLISSMAKFDAKKGWVINVNGQDKLIKDLRQTDMKNIKAQEETLEQRATDARTFDETLQDLILMFKQQLLPFAQQLQKGLGGPIQDMVKQWTQEGFFKTLREFVKTASSVVVSLGKWIIDIAKFLGPKGIVIAGLVAAFAGKAITWISNGMLLAKGFNMGTAGRGGGGGSDSMLDMLDIGDGKEKGKSGKMGKFGKIGKFLKGPGGAGLIAAGFAGYDEYSENSATGMGTGENIGRTVSKGGGAGAGAMAGAAFGAFAGPLGILIGGAIGGIAGSALGEEIGDAIWGDENATAVSAGRGKDKAIDFKSFGVNDGVMFHPQDKFLKVNDAITIAGTQAGGNAKLAEKMGNGGSSNETTHKFNDLNIKISVDAPGDSKFWESIVNQPDIMKKITQGVHISSEEASSGGKITGSGPKRRGK